ncbi:b(0,+)-type amino acid transporter 1 isoform X4 [Nematostella vectensis]|uniref:b(0,+)-type amino acid transporter 1 isoform X4 n=1 Tax=Nematostella vectensis TaxID=45351 RepID=UPI0020774926|nr:b(0,+)-type amino acid transporter 1 isoform X4 [Nematostella vectensis]
MATDSAIASSNPGFVPEAQNEELAIQTPPSSKSAPARLERKIGFVGGISIIVGSMIGSGIFASARWVMVYSGSVGFTLVVWSLCGLLCSFGALSYIELGLAIPKSGGERTYFKAAFGELPAFLYSWTVMLVIKPSALALILLTFATYLVEAFFPGCGNREDLAPLLKLLAAAAIGVITYVNCFSVKLATRVQVVFTAAKLIAIAMLIITGLVRLGQGFTGSFDDAFKGTTTSIGMVGFAFYNGLWAYDGWNNLNYVTEELKNPYRDLPRSILFGIPLVTVCYVLVNIAYLTVLTPVEVMASGAVAVTLSNRLYGVMAWTIPIFVACSTFGAANGSAFSGGRLVYVAAREGHLPEFLAMVHTKRHTPLPAMLFNSIIAWLMLLPDSSSFETLINYFSFAAWVFYGSTVSALLWLRYRKPEMERPYKVPLLVPIMVLLASLYLIIAPFYEAPLESFYCLLFILAGIPFYLVFVYFKVAPKWFLNGVDSITYKLQVLCDCALPESEEEVIAP